MAETQKSSLCGIWGYAKAEESLACSGMFRFPQTLRIVKSVLTEYTIKVIFLHMKWTVEFLNTTAEAEVDRLPPDMRAVLTRITTFIEEYGLENVGMPYVKHVQAKVWELRLKGRDGIARSLYVSATGCRVVILRTFIKKTAKTPHEELQLALKRAKEIV